jgi:hypothetical protein
MLVSFNQLGRELKVMSVMFLVTVTLLAVWLGFGLLWGLIHPSKPQTPAERLAELATERDQNVSQPIPKLGNASAQLRTRWSHGVVSYDLTLLDATPDLLGWLAKQRNYSFIVTWFENEKPFAQVLIPFAVVHPVSNASGQGAQNLSLNATGHMPMSQQTYEKLYDLRIWDLNWGPSKKSN